MRGPPLNQVGDVVGELTLVEYRPGQYSPRVVGSWVCKCSCGQVAVIRTDNLRQGRSRSCGHAQGVRREPRELLLDGPAVVKGKGLRAHHVRAAALTAHLGPWAALGDPDV